MDKGEVEILSIALIVALALTFVGLAYTWLYPWIERKLDEMKIERLLDGFDPSNPKSLAKKIEAIAKEGGEASFRVAAKGIWRIYPSGYVGVENNSIEFLTFSKAITGRVAVGMWKNLTEVGCPPAKGRVGEAPYAVCVRADPYAEGYNVVYRTTFRELKESELRASKIALEKLSIALPDTSTSEEIRIRRGEVYPKLANGKMLIITEVKISFV